MLHLYILPQSISILTFQPTGWDGKLTYFSPGLNAFLTALIPSPWGKIAAGELTGLLKARPGIYQLFHLQSSSSSSFFPFWLLSSFSALLLETMFEELPKSFLAIIRRLAWVLSILRARSTFFQRCLFGWVNRSCFHRAFVVHPAYMS